MEDPEGFGLQIIDLKTDRKLLPGLEFYPGGARITVWVSLADQPVLENSPPEGLNILSCTISGTRANTQSSKRPFRLFIKFTYSGVAVIFHWKVAPVKRAPVI